MAHTYDTKNRDEGVGNPITVAITPTSGATLLVVGIVTNGNVARTGGAPTFNAIALTHIASRTGGAYETSVEMWYLPNPSIGSYNVSVPNTGTNELHIVASVYKAQAGYTSTLDVTNGSSESTRDPDVSVTTTEDGDAIVDVLGSGNYTIPSGNNQTLLYETDDGNYCDAGQYDLQATAGGITFSWTIGSTEDWHMIVSAFKEEEIPAAIGHPWYYIPRTQ